VDIFIQFGAQYLYLVIGLTAVTVFFKSNNRIKNRLLVLGAIVFPTSYIIAKILGMFIQSPRPYIVEHITPLISASADNGFPSDHTLLAMAIAVMIFAYNRIVGGVLIVLAVAVGIARVLAHVHQVIDILGSIIIIVVMGYIAYRYFVETLAIKFQLDTKLFKYNA